MKEQLNKIIEEFEDIMYQMEDLRNVTEIFQDFMFDNCTAEMAKMQSVLNVQLLLTKQIGDMCQKLDKKMDNLLK